MVTTMFGLTPIVLSLVIRLHGIEANEARVRESARPRSGEPGTSSPRGAEQPLPGNALPRVAASIPRLPPLAACRRAGITGFDGQLTASKQLRLTLAPTRRARTRVARRAERCRSPLPLVGRRLRSEATSHHYFRKNNDLQKLDCLLRDGHRTRSLIEASGAGSRCCNGSNQPNFRSICAPLRSRTRPFARCTETQRVRAESWFTILADPRSRRGLGAPPPRPAN
jgi:hypothetical protein